MKCRECKVEIKCSKLNNMPECRDKRFKYCYCPRCWYLSLKNRQNLLTTNLNEDSPIPKELIEDMITCHGEIVYSVIAMEEL